MNVSSCFERLRAATQLSYLAACARLRASGTHLKDLLVGTQAVAPPSAPLLNPNLLNLGTVRYHGVPAGKQSITEVEIFSAALLVQL